MQQEDVFDVVNVIQILLQARSQMTSLVNIGPRSERRHVTNMLRASFLLARTAYHMIEVENMISNEPD